MTWAASAEAAAIDTAKQSTETLFAATTGGHCAKRAAQEPFVKTCGCCRQLEMRRKT